MSIIKKLKENVLIVERETDSSIVRNNRDACMSCEFSSTKDIHTAICNICTCDIEIKTLSRYHRNPKNYFKIERTHCPEGLWKYYDETTDRIMDSDLEIANFYKNN